MSRRRRGALDDRSWSGAPITGFGADVDRPGYDFVAQAECGWMAITGEPDGDPMKIGVALADVLAGKDAAIAILAALFRRQRTGQGRSRRHVARRQRAGRAGERRAKRLADAARTPKRWGNAHPNLVPYQLFQAADRPIVIAVGSDAQWIACARALGLPALADDAALANNAGRLAQRDANRHRISRARRGTSRPAIWRTRLDAAGVPNGHGAVGSRDASRHERLGADRDSVERWRARSLRAAGPRRARH